MSDPSANAVVTGPFGGPVHGVSVIDGKLADAMAGRGVVVDRIDLSPGRAVRGLAYHATRLVRTLGGFARILTVQGSPRHVMSVDGGGGILYDIALVLAIRARRQKLMLYHHSTRYVLGDNALMRLLLSVTGRDVPHIFCSERMAAAFRQRYGAGGQVLIVSNAAWIDPPLAPGPGSGGRFRLGFLSTLTEEKGLGRAIETLRRLRGQGLDAELVLAGPLVDQQAQETIRRAQEEFGAAFACRGVLRGADKNHFYETLDVFLFPSLYPHETQSLVVPEALAAGTPVVAYDHRYVGEMVGEGGWLVAADASFAEGAAEWILAGRDDWPTRRAAARRQFEREQARVAGQIGRLIDWVRAG